MREHNPIWQIFGPLTLLAGFALAAAIPLSSFPVDLFLSGAFGLYLSARWHLKGCSYALMLLALVGIAGHVFVEAHHFLRLGLEASFACSFFITAFSFESEAVGLSGLETQLTSRASAIQNLEEEIVKVREAHVEQQIASSKKVEELEKNYEEIASEKSSLEILNDVLRKANAAHFEEKTAIENRHYEDRRRLAVALFDLEQSQRELGTLKRLDLSVENLSLLKELNSARFDKEQTHQINETLVRLHAKESIRAKEADDQLQKALEEKQRIEQGIGGLQDEIAQLTQKSSKALEERREIEAQIETKTSELDLKNAEHQNEVQRLTQDLSRALEERQAAQARVREIETCAAQEEKESAEIEALKSERAVCLEQLAVAEEKVHELIKVNFLFKQLKTQFEEKNRVLHETRAALFKAETELQTVQIEKREEESFLPQPLSKELDQLDFEMESLSGENRQLQELVTYLTDQVPNRTSFASHRTPLPAGQPSLEETLREALIPKRKKKAKKPVQQDLLF